MKTTNKTENFLNLYKEVINSINYNEIYNSYSYSNSEIKNIYKNLENKVSNLENFFENLSKNLTKKNLITIIKEIEKKEIYFDKEKFYSTLEEWNINSEKTLNYYKKNWIITIIEHLIQNIIFDFQNLINHWNETNHIEL